MAALELGPPRGMRDFYPEDTRVRNAIFAAWRAASDRHGFAEYDACVVESLDLLKRKAGEEIVNQIYTFTDKSGRELALRPEMTPTLARMVAARHASLRFPIKWFCIAQCFRYERMTRGRKREHYQWNLDVIGEESVAAEAEVLATAAGALLDLGLSNNDFRVSISSRQVLSDLLSALGIAPDLHVPTFLCLDKLGKEPESEITRNLAAVGLDQRQVSDLLAAIAANSLDHVAAAIGDGAQSLLQIRSLIALLRAYGLDDVVTFDISVVRGLAYYTGIVFEAFDREKKLRALFGGGRYDNLIGDLGAKPLPGVGLGFGDVVIAELLADLSLGSAVHAPNRTAIGYMTAAQNETAVAVATALRRRGKPVDLALRAEKAKAFFSRAGNGDFAEAVFIGPDDVATGKIRIKNLQTRSETEMPISQHAPGSLSDFKSHPNC